MPAEAKSPAAMTANNSIECHTTPLTAKIIRMRRSGPTTPFAPVTLILAGFVLFAAPVFAQLPEGPGREEVMKRCVGCHEIPQAVSVRQDRNGWQTTIAKMIGLGMKATDKELTLILDYLVEHFPAEELPPVNINKANAIQIEARFSLLRSHAARIINYRRKNGDFQSLEDLKKVPDIDFAKIEAKKDSIIF